MLGDGDFDDARVALVLGIPIGNRAASGARRRRRRRRAAGARPSSPARARRSAPRCSTPAAGIETAGQRIEAARAARAAAEVQLEVERERYAAGMSTNFLVLTRQNDLSSARLDEIAALTNYRMSYAALARATGALLAERGIDVAAAAGRPGVVSGGTDVTKRMIIMLLLVGGFVAAIGSVKYVQIRAAMAQGAALPAASRGGDDGRGAARSPGRRRSTPSAP